MLANDMTLVNTVVFVFQQTQVRSVNVATWNMKALIVKEVSNLLNQNIQKQSPTKVLNLTGSHQQKKTLLELRKLQKLQRKKGSCNRAKIS